MGCIQRYNPHIRLFLSANYSASGAATVSTAAVSVSTVSTTSSTATVSHSSEQLVCSALLPQEANDTATTAANKNANFFIFFCFLICKTINCLLKRCKCTHFFDTMFFFSRIFFHLFSSFLLRFCKSTVYIFLKNLFSLHNCQFCIIFALCISSKD